MSKPNTVCRICGKEYFCCAGRASINSWKTMACSPACFQAYMEQLDKARKPKASQ